MPVARAGDLEVHVAVVIFGAGDVAEHGPLAGLLVHHEAHRHAGDRRLERHAGVHQRQRAAADRRHRRRAVRFEDVGDDADGVGEFLFGGQQRHERALGERAVADFAPAGAAQELHFADRERREVVVEHEAAVGLALHRLNLLRVVFRAERRGDERLRLAAREHGRAVDAGQHAGFDPDRTDLIEAAAVEPLAALEDLVAHDLFFQVLEDRSWRRCGARLRLRECSRRDPPAPCRRSRSSRACPGCASPRPAARRPSLRPRGRTRGRSPWPSTVFLVLPHSRLRSSIAATICLMAACAASSAPIISSSVACFAPASTIMIASALPATTRSILLCLRSA